MNLTSMLREGSLTDVGQWWGDGLVSPGEVSFDPEEYGMKNPNNIKPEAQQQWGYGDISPVFDDNAAGTVERNIPKDNAGDVILFARDAMNRGANAATVDRELKARFPQEQMRKVASELKELFELQGIIGRIAVDARGYDDCKAALAAAEHSPYKRFIKFVIGCSCGDPQMIPVADEKLEMVASTGNAADDFFAAEGPYEAREIPCCPSTRLPLYAAIDDVDPSWMNDLMIVVENITGEPGDSDDDTVEKVKSAFRALDRVAAERHRARYSEPVNASEYIVDAMENEIDAPAHLGDDSSVDVTAGMNDTMNEVDAPVHSGDDSSVDMTANMSGTIFEDSDVVDLDPVPEQQRPVDVDLGDSEIAW